MIFYFIILTFSIVLAIVLVLAGLFAKKRMLWLSGIGFVVVAVVFGALLLAQTVEKAQQLAAETSAVFSKKTDGAVEMSGELIGEGFGKFVNGLSKGLDNTVDAVKVAPHDDLIEKGLKFQVAESYNGEQWNDNLLVVYVIYEKDFAGTLQMKLYNHQNQEIGRTKIWVENGAGEAEYLEFQFNKYTDYLQGGYATLVEVDDPKPTETKNSDNAE
ncbi:MAG: hypothetical protein ACFB10_04010 [Salibacteraceae bacterium]